MIRLGKPVQLLEWGEGTTTLNQNWQRIGAGVLRSKPKNKAGTVMLAVELNSALEKKNREDNSIKIMQQGEAMTPHSERWGEVAMGKLSSVAEERGKTVVYIEIRAAAKIGIGSS